MFPAPPANLAEVEKIKQAGMNARHRSILEEIGYQILSNSMSLGVEAFKYHQLGGVEKTAADTATSAAKTATAAAATSQAGTDRMYATSAKELAGIAQAGITDSEGGLRPGYDVNVGRQGTQLTTPPAAAALSRKDWIFDKTLVNADGTRGGKYGDGMRPMSFAERQKLKATGPPRGQSIKEVDPNKKDQAALAGLQAEIENLRAGPLKKRKGSPEYEAASRRLTSLQSQAAVLYRRMNMKVPAFEGAGEGGVSKATTTIPLKSSLPLSGWNNEDMKRLGGSDLYGENGTLNDMISKFSTDNTFMTQPSPDMAWPTPEDPDRRIEKGVLLAKVADMSRPDRVEFFRQLAEESANGNNDATTLLNWIRVNM